MRSGLAMGGPERYHWVSVAAKRRLPGGRRRTHAPFAAAAAPFPRWEELVDRCASTLHTTLDDAARASVRGWLERLQRWSERIDLTAARNPEELVDLILADALFLAQRIPGGATRIVDVGSGAGGPGLGLALVREELRVTLVEPNGKRASFLRTVVGALGRTNVAIERVHGESLANRRAWDVAVSRATFAPAAWLALGATLVEPGGRVVVLLAREPPPDFAHASVESDESYVWPLTGAKRRAVVYRVPG